MGFGMVHPYIFIHFMEMFFILVSLVCVNIVRRGNVCVVQPQQMCFKAERGFKTHRATVREGINTDGERDCSQQSGQQLAAGVHVTAV